MPPMRMALYWPRRRGGSPWSSLNRRMSRESRKSWRLRPKAQKTARKGQKLPTAARPQRLAAVRRQAEPGENPGRVTVADDAHGEGHQDGVEAEDRVEDPDLGPGELEAPL